MGQRLVPVGDAAVVVGAVVGVAVLDGDAQALREENRVHDVVAVDGDPLVVAVVRTAVVGDAVVEEGVVRLAPPRLVVPVLAARAVEVRRPLLAVDHDGRAIVAQTSICAHNPVGLENKTRPV